MNSNSIDPSSLILILFIFLVLFFALRPVLLWYYKIDEKMKLLKDQNDLLKEIKEHMIFEWKSKQENNLYK